MTLLLLVASAQAAYYLLTGLWPLVNSYTFQKVTGFKTDVWLVKTVGTLFAAIGAALAIAVFNRDLPPSMAVLAVSAAIGVIIIDVVYVAKKVIGPIYLFDALAEAILVLGWAIGWWGASQ